MIDPYVDDTDEVQDDEIIMRDDVTERERIEEIKEAGIQNIMALRGDIPKDLLEADRSDWDYKYAIDLIRELKAADAGVTPQEYVDNAAGKIKEIWDLMDVSYDKFIRTTDDYHVSSVQTSHQSANQYHHVG